MGFVSLSSLPVPSTWPCQTLKAVLKGRTQPRCWMNLQLTEGSRVLLPVSTTHLLTWANSLIPWYFWRTSPSLMRDAAPGSLKQGEERVACSALHPSFGVCPVVPRDVAKARNLIFMGRQGPRTAASEELHHWHTLHLPETQKWKWQTDESLPHHNSIRIQAWKCLLYGLSMFCWQL